MQSCIPDHSMFGIRDALHVTCFMMSHQREYLRRQDIHVYAYVDACLPLFAYTLIHYSLHIDMSMSTFMSVSRCAYA